MAHKNPFISAIVSCDRKARIASLSSGAPYTAGEESLTVPVAGRYFYLDNKGG